MEPLTAAMATEVAHVVAPPVSKMALPDVGVAATRTDPEPAVMTIVAAGTAFPNVSLTAYVTGAAAWVAPVNVTAGEPVVHAVVAGDVGPER